MDTVLKLKTVMKHSRIRGEFLKSTSLVWYCYANYVLFLVLIHHRKIIVAPGAQYIEKSLL